MLIFLGLFIIIVLFYPSTQDEAADKITKSKDCCFSQQNESCQLDCSVRNPCTNGACEIKKRKLIFMDNTSLRDIIKRNPELKFRYIGSFPADFVPNLLKFSFAFINTSPRTVVGEHWIMIGRLKRNYYYADSLARSVTHYKFLNKKYQKMIHRQLQKMQDLCGFYTTYAAFHLFKFLQTNLNNVHDVQVLIFINNYM